ncbi:MAG: hypothetical protein KBE41_11835 [Lutibacter sp.]|nr:hypothetical protein [Lutibacter sp.]MBP9602183.1 hypothetical protein [Lutibacter sp.]
MKKAILVIVVFVVSSMSLYANEIEAPIVSKDEIRTQIVDLLKDVNTNLSTEAAVDVTFTFNTDGEIVVLSVNSTNKEVLKFIRQNLNGKQIEKPGRVKREYTMPINVRFV